MKKSLKALLKGIIDYAGLFPPAELSLEEAIQNFARYRKGSDAWMLSHFIIPASRLDELTPYAGELFSAEDPFAFSVLGKATETVAEFHKVIEDALGSCRSFCKKHQGGTTNMLEMKLPKEVAFSHDKDLLLQLMNQTAEKLSRSDKTPARIFYEGFLDESWEKDIEAIMQAISMHNKSIESGNENYTNAGFKLRCGGIEADQFPTIGQVALVLKKAREFEVPLKGTAGLHHPVRHYEEMVKTKMHGFLNVFCCAMLAYSCDLPIHELEEILGEEDAEQFLFKDEAFRWKGYSISTPEISALRETALLSYGSCSFDEPREDLKKLNLW